jgi:hypothetical protein
MQILLRPSNLYLITRLNNSSPLVLKLPTESRFRTIDADRVDCILDTEANHGRRVLR